MAFKTDIEIAREAKKKPIMEIGAKLGIPSEHLLPYGHDKAKVSQEFIKSLAGRPDGKLILVTAINPTPAGEGKTTTTVGLGDGLNRIGKKAVVCIREASLGPNFGMKGGAAGGGYAPGRADGRDEPALHRRFSRHHIGPQPAVGDDRQPYLLGQRSGHRRAPGRVAPGDGHERPRAARHRGQPWRRVERLSASDRVRHHRGVGSHGDPVPVERSGRPADPSGQHRRGLYPREKGDLLPRHQGRWRDDGAAEGRDAAEPGADAGKQPGLRAWRPVCQHRPWLQFGHRHQDGAEAGRICRDRSGFRGRPGRREVL